MKLSLVVPCYNEAENVALFQEETIKAFQGCGYSYEIIFVDDGSKDLGGKMCDAYAGKDSRIRVLHKENGGLMNQK